MAQVSGAGCTMGREEKKKAGSGKKCLQHKGFMAYPLTI